MGLGRGRHGREGDGGGWGELTRMLGALVENMLGLCLPHT